MNSTDISNRDKRLTTNVNQSEFETILESAKKSGYGKNATGRFIRDQLLNSPNSAEKTTIEVPKVSADASKQLKGAVNNLNQFMRKLHELSISNSPSIVHQEAKAMMKTVVQVAKICQNTSYFLDGNIKNKNRFARMVIDYFSVKEIERILQHKKKELAK